MKIDLNFVPMTQLLKDLAGDCKRLGAKPLAVCVEREHGFRRTFRMEIAAAESHFESNYRAAERVIKSLLWIYGGYKLIIGGDEAIAERIRSAYAAGGVREFDANTMSRVYGLPFEVLSVPSAGEVPGDFEQVSERKSGLSGCRIGFDAGGSDRKVSAVIDGEAVYSEETVWLPKVTADPDYHLQGILESFRAAAAHMPRVDAIGVSSAGIYIDNQVRIASLFVSVPDELFDSKVKNIYIDAAKEFGNVPLTVANDGDVTAIAGAMSLGKNKVLGIAMGTSEAGGYADENGNLRGWLNELAFVPADAADGAAVDPWSGDFGCGAVYHSQEAPIRLAGMCGIDLSAHATPAEKLKAVQALAEAGDARALDIFSDVGEYLAHSIAYYTNFYDAENLLILGRVTSGRGGEVLFETCNAVLKSGYPDIARKVSIVLPDEKSRRVGQSVAAASLTQQASPVS